MSPRPSRPSSRRARETSLTRKRRSTRSAPRSATSPPIRCPRAWPRPSRGSRAASNANEVIRSSEMSDDLPKPEPKEVDEKLALQLKHLAEDAVLKGQPYGEEKCDN